MKSYKYIGTTTTGVTLQVGGEDLEVMLYPGRTTELPEADPWVERMARRGYLVPVDGKAKSGTETKRKTKTAPAPEPLPEPLPEALPAPESPGAEVA